MEGTVSKRPPLGARQAAGKSEAWIPIAGRRGYSAGLPNARVRPGASVSALDPVSVPREATPATEEEGGGLGRGRREAAAEKRSPRDSRPGGRTSGPQR